MMCQECKDKPVAVGRKLYCSDICSRAKNGRDLVLKRKQRILDCKVKTLANFHGVVIPQTDCDKDEPVTFQELGLGWTEITGLHLSDTGIIPTIKIIPKTRIGSEWVREFEVKAYTLNDLEKIIRYYESGFKQTAHLNQKNAMNKWLRYWNKMNKYLKDSR